MISFVQINASQQGYDEDWGDNKFYKFKQTMTQSYKKIKYISLKFLVVDFPHLTLSILY